MFSFFFLILLGVFAQDIFVASKDDISNFEKMLKANCQNEECVNLKKSFHKKHINVNVRKHRNIAKKRYKESLQKDYMQKRKRKNRR